MNLYKRSFLTLLDYTPEEITYLIDLAAKLKQMKKRGIPHRLCEGKNIVLIFEKTSTRTRCSFEVASYDLGMSVTYLDPTGSQMSKKETIADTARVLGRMYDAIEYRGYGQSVVSAIAEYSGVPVYNGLTNEYHPTQILADMLTVREKKGTLKGRKLVYMGDARYNMGNSLMIGCAKLGMHFTACAPADYLPSPELTDTCRAIARETGGQITLSSCPEEAVKGADVIYTDVWVSMGEPKEVWDERVKQLTPYRVTAELMAAAGEEALFMHCLPAFHNRDTEVGRAVCEQYGMGSLEVTDEVFEGSRSIVFDEAENRMHTIKAVIAATLAEPNKLSAL